jgi:Bacteriophage protein gp37
MSFNQSDIRWTDRTWNPVHGCSKTSQGCANCYAERVSRRFGHTDFDWIPEHAGENVQIKHEMLDDRLGEPAWVFVNSMSDLYHDEVPRSFIRDVFHACREMSRSAFQVLTKHGPDRERASPHPPDNVMLGVSVEAANRRYRLDWLRKQPVATRFVSFEPLVEPIAEVNLTKIDWAIIGGESGPQHREMDPDWARTLVRECREQDVAVFFKQHSGQYPEDNTRLLIDGLQRRIEEFPELPHDVAPAPKAFREGVTA